MTPGNSPVPSNPAPAAVQRLLAAAAAVLEARADQMLTRVEWRELRDAVVACGGNVPADVLDLDDVATDQEGVGR